MGTPRQPLAWKRVDLVLDDEGTELRARARRLPAAFAPTLKIPKTSVLCEILEFLAEPRTFAELSAQFPAVDLRPKLRVLERSRLILPRDRDEREELVERFAEQLPRLAEAVANDLLGFGAALFGGDRQGAGEAIEQDLTAAVALLAKAQDGLRREREPYVQQQCAGLGLAQRRDGLKLHLGGTSLPAADWINVDLQPADLRLNLRWGLPFAGGAARFVYASHLLEHFYYHEAEALLAEIRRVLCPGGVVRLVVPDIGACIAAYSARDEAFFERRMELWPWAVNCVTPLEHFLSYAGAGATPADLTGHKYGYDFETLAAMLRRCGFKSVESSSLGASRHPELRVDDAAGTAGFAVGDRHYSLFIEAGG